jgi:hypothetical protein
MQDRVPSDRVRLTAPRIHRLSVEQQHEATRLLAALLANAAERHGHEAERECTAGRCSVPFSGPASVRSSGWTRGPSNAEIPSKQAISTTGKQPRQ